MTAAPVGTTSLATTLREETEVYGSLLALAVQEERAIIDGDVELLTELVGDKERMLELLAALETERTTALTAVALGIERDPPNITLSEVARHAEPHAAGVLMEAGMLLRAQAVALREANSRNAGSWKAVARLSSSGSSTSRRSSRVRLATPLKARAARATTTVASSIARPEAAPMAISVGLDIAVRALLAQQMGVDTVAHNIANVNTDGYSRQRLGLDAVPGPQLAGRNGPGHGVIPVGVDRVRDLFVDQQLRDGNQTSGRLAARAGLMQRVEQVLQEPSDFGLRSALSRYWNAWRDVSS